MYEKSRVFPYHILRESSCLFWGPSFEILGGKFWARTAKIDPLRMPDVHYVLFSNYLDQVCIQCPAGCSFILSWRQNCQDN